MAQRPALPSDKRRVVNNGINLDGFHPAKQPPSPPVIGYFARMCREKGLDTLVEAYIILRRRNNVPGVRLKVGGGCGPSDEPFVAELQRKLEAAGFLGDTEFRPNLSRQAKQEFMRSFSVFSVPALYGEAFGLYLLEAWGTGVPVVQPRHAAFPELVDSTGGGAPFVPGRPEGLADGLDSAILDATKARGPGDAGPALVLR